MWLTIDEIFSAVSFPIQNCAANGGTLRPHEFHLNLTANTPPLHEVFQPVFLGSNAHVEVHEIAGRLDNGVPLLE